MPLLNILLVDSDATFAEVAGGSLRGDGHRVTVARDAAAALMIAPELAPDVVLLDVRLPDGDGYELARKLRRQLPARTPIIVVTGAGEANLEDEVDLVLNKPIQCELFSGLIEYIRRRRQNLVMR